MKKLLLAIALTSGLVVSNAQAQYLGPVGGGGYEGPSATQSILTVKEAEKLRDDAYVKLRGNIVQHINKDKYLFRDATGEIVIEIDRDKWRGLVVNDKDTVEIVGEIDKDWNSIEIDVDYITKVQ